MTSPFYGMTVRLNLLKFLFYKTDVYKSAVYEKVSKTMFATTQVTIRVPNI